MEGANLMELERDKNGPNPCSRDYNDDYDDDRLYCVEYFSGLMAKEGEK